MTVTFGDIQKYILALLLLLTASFAQAGLHGSYTGSWYDPEFNGAGFIIEALAEDRAVVYWFTYDNEGNQVWYVGVGESTENSININELLISDGGVFGDVFDPDAIELVDVGQATFTFSNCNTASVEFSVEGVASSQSLTRLTNVRDLDCSNPDQISERPTVNQTGSWYDTSRSGEGFIVEVLADQLVVVYWFTYDPEGNQAWLTGIGYAAENVIHIEEMMVTRNGFFGPEHDPTNVVFDYWGSIELQLSCDSGIAIYDALDPQWGHGDHPMTRLTLVNDLDCRHEDFSVVAGNELDGLWQSDGFGYAALIDESGFSIMQHTASSCLEIAAGPVSALEGADDDLLVNKLGDRLRFSGLDSVSAVRFDRVDALPATCANGGSGFSNDPVYNFNTFRDTFAELYSAFDVRNVDWAALTAQYQPGISVASSPTSLFNVFTNMLMPLRDGHVSVVTPDSVFHYNGDPVVTALFQKAFMPVVDDIIKNRYLNGNRFEAANGALRYGMLGGGIAYLEITRFNGVLDGANGEETRAFLRDELDKVFAWFRDQGIVGLAIDVRRNDGGNFQLGLEIAGRLVHGPGRIAFSERRPTTSGDTDPIATMVKATEGEGFNGPVALLTSRLTASAAESFALAVRALPQVTTIGGASYGVLSRTERILPNGWIVSITAGNVEAPNGKRYEAIGIPVDITTDIFSSVDTLGGADSALEAALVELN